MITHTIEKLDVLEPEAIDAELSALEKDAPELVEQVTSLMNVRSHGSSFMQTRMPQLDAFDRSSLAPKSRVGVWEIEELIGSGGMGEVFRAHRADGLFEQQVALKLAKTKGVTFRERFDAERQRLAQLEHPNIARIVDGGVTEDGAPYMTMEFVDGRAIDVYSEANVLDRSERLGLVQKLCSAVSHAHGRLVLHRDIKHDNVLINQDGELRLIDFGVASLVDDTSEEGLRGPLTLAYAAPEQLRGEPVSAATDIFAIGMLVHLLEVGALPKRQPDGGVAIDSAELDDKDLVAILAKATANTPSDRYASIDALRDDLRKFVGGFPVSARPISSMTRFHKLIARNKLTAAMSGAAIAALVAGVIGVSVFAVRANEEAEANRIAQSRGANTIELYETFNSGFSFFVASIDQDSPQGQAIFESLGSLENRATRLESTDPQKSIELYVLLAEIYADSGRDQDASRVALKLARIDTEMTYPIAFTLAGLVHLSQGLADDASLFEILDRLHLFFKESPEIHSFDIALNRCIKARMSTNAQDAKTCIELATAHLATINRESYVETSGNLPLQGYAIRSAITLEDYGAATQIAEQALEFFQTETRPGSVPEAAFWLDLSDVAQLKEDWTTSINHLQSARKSLEGNPQFPWLDIAINMELAQVQNRLEQYESAQANAQEAELRARQIFGADHYQVRDAKAQVAVALAGLGNDMEAEAILKEIIAAEASGDNDPEALEKYRRMLSNVLDSQP